jgi:type III secretion protein C
MTVMSLRTLACLPVIAGTLLAVSQDAAAADPSWVGSRFVYLANGSSVSETLNLFAARQDLRVRLSGPVDSIVSGRFAMSPRQFIDTLCEAYGLVWYYDGAVLQVSRQSDQQHVEIRPNFMSAPALRAALDHAAVSDAHFPLQVDDTAGTVLAAGPADYIERVRGAAQRFEASARAHVRTTVHVFRLSAATAADETRTIDDREVSVPGAATLLRRRFHQRADGAAIPAAAAAHLPQVVEFDAPLPIIEADAQTNSILIRDKPERIDGDGMLIADVDVRPELISVETRVVDVDAGAFAALQAVFPAQLASTASSAPQLAFGTLADGGHALLAQLEELARTRLAQVEVSRTAFTLDRSPAVIDRHEARLAQRDAAAAASDLWLSVEPTVSGSVSLPTIGLRVDLGRDGAGTQQQRVVAASVTPGECLVIAAPASGSADSRLPRRLILLIPRIAA